MEIKKRLQLELHPIECVDNSIVDARNVMLSSSGSVIINENSIDINQSIFENIEEIISDFRMLAPNIVCSIPCSDEIVYIVRDQNPNIKVNNTFIIRYIESSDTFKVCAEGYENSGYPTIGTYTYNGNDELIVAIAEDGSSDGKQIPLKVINLGTKDGASPDYYTKDSLLSIVPEITIPNIDYDVVPGSLYKGWYKIFIRYKINDFDYTQWYNIGNSIYIDEVFDEQTFLYSFGYSPSEGVAVGDRTYLSGFKDRISKSSDVCNKSISIDVDFVNNDFKYFQIAFVCNSDDYEKCQTTSDIFNSGSEINVILSTYNTTEYSKDLLYEVYNNYYNVKNLINYNNRLYISGYESFKFEYERDSIELNYVNSDVIINTDSYGNQKYDLSDFNKISKIRTLIPFGIYNFYFHLINKYGEISDGYKIDLTNYVKVVDVNGNEDVTKGVVRVEYSPGNNCYIAVGYDEDIYSIGLSEQFTAYSGINDLGILINDITESVKSDVVAYFRTIPESDIKVVNYFNEPISSNGITYFNKYVSSNGDVYARIPNFNSIRWHGFDITCHQDSEYKFFVSYEKHNSFVEDGLLSSVNDSDEIYLSNSTFNIKNDNRLDYNQYKSIEIYEEGPYSRFQSIFNQPPASATYDSLTLSYYKNLSATSNINVINSINPVTSPDNINFIIINSINSSIDFDNFDIETIKLITLINAPKNIYSENNKILIRCTRGYDAINSTYKGSVDSYDFNGVITNKSVILSNIRSVKYNESEYFVYANDRFKYTKDGDLQTSKYYETFAKYENDLGIKIFGVPVPYRVVNYLTISTFFHESKRYNVEPKEYVISNKADEIIEFDKTTYTNAKIITTNNYPDLYKLHIRSKDDYNTYVFTNDTYTSDIIHTKTIRRSDFISDESVSNSWRNFPVEGYKTINENKGDITNLIGIGSSLMVHTEHSLFIFDRDPSLQTVDKDLMLYQPDAFDIDYREVFTSDKGYGGLHDKSNSIVDSFGYIFYDKKGGAIYRFDNSSLTRIDRDIINYINKYNPDSITFCNDPNNDRVLMMFKIGNIREVISYNYSTGVFISRHDYIYDGADNTRSNVYFYINRQEDFQVYSFGSSKSIIPEDLINTTRPSLIGDRTIAKSSISIINNSDYFNVKFLEYIRYKVSKSVIGGGYDTSVADFSDYSGSELLVKTNKTSTVVMYIDTSHPDSDRDIFKPNNELGVWNYNNFRTPIIDYTNPVDVDKETRIYGNHFVFKFTFENGDDEELYIEGFEANLTKGR